MVELLVAIGVLSVLGLALAQMMATGMSTWRSGEVRRGAYERAQYVFDRVRSDLATLQPRDPEIPDSRVFEDYWLPGSHELFSGTVDEIGNFGGVSDPTAEMTVRQDAEAGTVYLAPTALGSEAAIEYEIRFPFVARAVVIEPRIALRRSSEYSANSTVFVETAERPGSSYTWSEYTLRAEFVSGLHDQTITPPIALTQADLRNDTREIRVRLSIEPWPGQTSNARLFETEIGRLSQPVMRVQASPRPYRPGVRLVSGYRSGDSTQFLVFVRNAGGRLQEVAYFLEDGALFRAERGLDSGGDSLFLGPPPLDDTPSGTTVARVAEGLIYFGCSFPRRGDGEQLYWNEAGSVPSHIRVSITTIPLSGPTTETSLREAIDAEATTLPVHAARGFILGDPERQVVKIGDEWVRYVTTDGNRLMGCSRGVRGTVPAAHGEGEAVVAGNSFRAEISIPAGGSEDR